MSPTSSFFYFLFSYKRLLGSYLHVYPNYKTRLTLPTLWRKSSNDEGKRHKKNQQQQSPIVVTIGINTHTLQTLSQSCTWNKKHWRMWSPKFFTVQHSNRPETDRTPLKRKTPRGVCLGVSAIDFLYTLYNQASLLNKRWRIISVLWSIELTLTRG